jgi:flavodoxin
LKLALLIYFSSSGNTQKAAYAIKEGLESGGMHVDLKKPQEAAETDFFNYDLVCLGSPSIEWQPAKPIADLLKAKRTCTAVGKIALCSKGCGENVLSSALSVGPHTGR